MTKLSNKNLKTTDKWNTHSLKFKKKAGKIVVKIHKRLKDQLLLLRDLQRTMKVEEAGFT